MGFADDDLLSYEPDYDKGVDEREEIMLSVTQESLFDDVLEQFGKIFGLPIDLGHFKMVDETGIERLTTQNLPHSSIVLQSNMVKGMYLLAVHQCRRGGLMLSEPSSGPFGSY